MTRLRLIPFALIAVLSVGCADVPTADSSSEVFLAVSGPVAAGAEADARLVNNSSERVEFGWLPCEARTDRQTPSGWVEVPRESVVCILPLLMLSPRGRYWFQFKAPSAAGTFRLRADVSGESVTSAPFVVR